MKNHSYSYDSDNLPVNSLVKFSLLVCIVKSFKQKRNYSVHRVSDLVFKKKKDYLILYVTFFIVSSY